MSLGEAIRTRRGAAVFVLMAVAIMVVGLIAMAASLTGSYFEIDLDANLKVDGNAQALDWANVAQTNVPDFPSGTGDDSFGQGSKEDTADPVVVSGSIPPNKSDLKDFGVYVEENADGKFLHLYWTRVQDPSGTTNMDFEFNQNKCEIDEASGDPTAGCSANGITPTRLVGDLLITYDLAKGGTEPEISLREWEGSAWGAPESLTAESGAIGSINTTAIPEGESDGLGALDPRTFGEASIDLALIFNPEVCQSFGSAYLKSRSSDSFTAALKDFIAPEPVNISNCGSVTVKKVTVPAGDTVTAFGFTTNIEVPDGDTTVTATISDLKDGGEYSIDGAIAATDRYIREDDPTPGYDLTGVACVDDGDDASVGTPDLPNRKVDFHLEVGQSITCTFTNSKIPTLTLVKSVVNDGGGTAVATSWSLSASGTSGGFGPIVPTAITPPASGYTSQATTGAQTVDAGVEYTLSESSSVVGYAASSWVCDSNYGTLTDGKLTLSYGDDVTCAITNDDIDPTLTLVKSVVNDGGGTAVATSWSLSASGTSGGFGPIVPTAVTPPASGYTSQATTGAQTVDAGVEYTLSESSSVVGYAASSWACDSNYGTLTDGKLTLSLNEAVTCGIVNDDIEPKLTINKVLVPSSDTGTFDLKLDGTTKKSAVGDGGTTGAMTLSAGTYTVSEAGAGSTDLTDYATAITGDCDASGSVSLALADNKTCTITNTRLGELTINKSDDAGNALEGVAFTLYTDSDPSDEELDLLKDSATTYTCTTNASGTCSIAKIALGSYWAVETTPPSAANYANADPQKLQVDAGTQVTLNFENPRLHKVFVYVCHEGTDTLVTSDVQIGSDEFVSLSRSDLSGSEAEIDALEALLCGFDTSGSDQRGVGSLGHGSLSVSVDVGRVGEVEIQ